MRTIDLCCGIGGIRRGFELAGKYQNVISAEIDDYACRTYEHLYGENPKNDVKSPEFKKKLKDISYDILLAGFPCQTFSRVGLRKGFKDKTKGTIFFDIVEIIETTAPKAVFLENVENLVSHDNGETFRTILSTLEKELNYYVVGVKREEDGELSYKKSDFLRNTKDFGLPQNRPRTYIIAFSRNHFSRHLEKIPTELPKKGSAIIYNSVSDILEDSVPAGFFLAEGFLKTLEDHKARQKKSGNGFGYRVVNMPGAECTLACTILATGGSGKERNLVYDFKNGKKYAGTVVKGKKTAINRKFIRYMTPAEWGKLQGFIGYAFVNGNGVDRFSFPQKLSNQQKYKQFGNSVSVPVIREMAVFVRNCFEMMEKDFSEEEKEWFAMRGSEFAVCRKIRSALENQVRSETLKQYYGLVLKLGTAEPFATSDIAQALSVSGARASQIANRLLKHRCIIRQKRGVYSFDCIERHMENQGVPAEEVSE